MKHSKINELVRKVYFITSSLMGIILLEALDYKSVHYIREELGYVSWISAVPYFIGAILFIGVSLKFKLSKINETLVSYLKPIIHNNHLIIKGVAVVLFVLLVNIFFLYLYSDYIGISSAYNNFSVACNTIIRKLLYSISTLIVFITFHNNIKDWISNLYSVPLYAFTLVITNYFSGDYYIIPLNFVFYLIIGYTIVTQRTGVSLLSSLAYNFLSTALLCACGQYVFGALVINTQQDLGYMPAFLYSFQIVAMGLVAAYYGRQAYLLSMNRAELVDRGYMMVRDQHGLETPMLRATYQYNIMQAIKPWIALTEAGKKRKRGMVITQKLQKGWAFHEVFNAQGEPLTHGFIDANMDLERMPQGYLQDNRPKLAIAWELDTEALYYLRVEFEGETLYGALRMFFNAEERAKQPQNFMHKLSNNWIHPNEEEILSCVLYKANGEEVLVKALYGKYHDS